MVISCWTGLTGICSLSHCHRAKAFYDKCGGDGMETSCSHYYVIVPFQVSKQSKADEDNKKETKPKALQKKWK